MGDDTEFRSRLVQDAHNVGNGQCHILYPRSFEQNRTGAERSAAFKINDTRTDDAYINFSLYQYATRGDGSLGNASLVSSIVGETKDAGGRIIGNSSIDITYDRVCRPLSLVIKTVRPLFTI